MGRMAGPHVSVVLPTMGTTGHPGDPEHIVATARAAERLGFDGVTFPGIGAVCLDPIPPTPVPLFFGGRRPAALRRAAHYGDGWIGWLHSASGFGAVREVLPELRSWRRCG
jgi:alkanesulfonate monooxygenase SsuD/methylene tetrahydromethanopterin reductase-like flavin-dependent oxidoreductase (luciferase family)